jgi:glycosyltransferase involved in cell wall biosynthesis
MKIVQVLPYYFPRIGGVETHVLQVNQELKRRGFEVVVLTTQHDESLALDEVQNGIRIVRLPRAAIEKKIPTWKWICSQIKILEQADVIQVHDIFWWLWPVLPFVEDKMFTTFHGWEGRYPVRWQAKFQRRINALFSCATIHVGEWIQEFYWDKPTLITYGGVDSSLTKSAAPTELEKIVFFGRLSTDNEVSKYSELVKELQKNHKKLQITWVGDGELKDECSKIGKVTGLVADPTSYLKSADLVFSASYLSMLQAQAMGKIVCAFYSHPLKERYLETFPGSVWMLISSYPEDMAEQIKHVFENKKKRTELSSGAHKLAQSQSWSKVVDTYEQLWNV